MDLDTSERGRETYIATATNMKLITRLWRASYEYNTYSDLYSFASFVWPYYV